MNIISKRLGEEKIGSLLIKLSLPATVGMFINALYNVVDAIFLGNFVGEIAIGALAIAFPIQMIPLGFGQLIGMGSASVISRNLGAKNFEKAYLAGGNAITSILILGILCSIAGLLFINPILRAFGATEEILPFAYEYMSIIFLGSTFFTFIVCNNNIIRSEGNAKKAMISMLVGAAGNIILDPIFIIVFKMGIKGAALATILAQFAAFLYVIRYFTSGKSSLKFKMHHFKLNYKVLYESITIGISAFVRTISSSIVMLAVNNMLKVFGGTDAITIMGIVNRILMFVLMPLFGIVQGMNPIVGFNYGAKQYERVKETLKLTIISSCTVASISFLICMLFPNILIDIFVNDPKIINEGARVFRYVILMTPILGIQIIGTVFYQSIGKAGKALFLALLRQVIIFSPLVIIMPRLFNLGINGVWYAFPIADLAATIITAFMLLYGIRKMFAKVENTQLESRA